MGFFALLGHITWILLIVPIFSECLQSIEQKPRKEW